MILDFSETNRNVSKISTLKGRQKIFWTIFKISANEFFQSLFRTYPKSNHFTGTVEPLVINIIKVI